MVKVPESLQPAPVPVSVQFPVIELLMSVPSRVSWFVPLVFAAPDWMVIWKVPVVWPPDVPVEVNAPVAVVPTAKHDDEVEKLRLLTVRALPLSASVDVKTKACCPFASVNVAVQVPLIVPPELLLPQPDHTITMKSMIATPKCFIESSMNNNI
jgi:hypothetical protein